MHIQVDAQEADGVGPELTVKQERLVYYLVQVWTPHTFGNVTAHGITPHLWLSLSAVPKA